MDERRETKRKTKMLKKMNERGKVDEGERLFVFNESLF